MEFMSEVLGEFCVEFCVLVFCPVSIYSEFERLGFGFRFRVQANFACKVYGGFCFRISSLRFRLPGLGNARGCLDATRGHEDM